MNTLLTPQGEYLTTQFTGSNGKWRLISTQTNPNSYRALDALDTFTNDKGDYKTIARSEVAKLFKLKKIWL